MDESALLLPGLRGLSNLGNTCYMNATLQCLSHAYLLTQPFHEQVRSSSDGDASGQDCESLVGAFKALLTLLWEGGPTAVTPLAFREILCKRLPQFSGRQQHDSPEFLAALLNCLHEELQRPPASNLVTDVFAGSLRNTIYCPECKSEFKHSEDFLCLPVPLPETDTMRLYFNVVDQVGVEPLQYGIKIHWSSRNQIYKAQGIDMRYIITTLFPNFTPPDHSCPPRGWPVQGWESEWFWWWGFP